MVFARLYAAVFGGLSRLLDGWLPSTLARVIFAGVLFMFFWNSAMTKIGDGVAGFFTVSVGAYVQILPKQMEAVSFDPSALSTLDHLIVYAGTYTEIILPILIVAGLFTRLAALGMIGFVAVMTYTDITQHGVDASTIGAWFDGDPSAAIADQRALWMLLFVVLFLKGPGPFSLDAILGRVAGRR
ncbi:MAG: DoxX family protein [Pseudomonadota bacterium]